MTSHHAALQRALMVATAALTLSACHGGAKDVPGDAQDHAPFHEISESDRLHVVGTEPFWSGEIASGRMTYFTPDSPEPEVIAVSRFAGRGGLSFSGERKGAALTLAIAPGICSDGMSDRTYPYTAMLRIGAETRQGCAWTDARPGSGPSASATESR